MSDQHRHHDTSTQPTNDFRQGIGEPTERYIDVYLGHGTATAFRSSCCERCIADGVLTLTGILLVQGSNDPLSINIRYTFLVAPALFAGSIYWWKSRQSLFHSRRLKSIWNGCITLSLIFAIAGNQNRSFSFAIPDSIQPWVYASPIPSAINSRRCCRHGSWWRAERTSSKRAQTVD